ncbi:hypothetical protein HG530_014379 [Fusarium avenaceum]|nr:hypothetical protein HG530_014379 [Fusarium avenaceum]
MNSKPGFDNATQCVDQINLGEIWRCSAVHHTDLTVESCTLIADPDVFAVLLSSTNFVFADTQVVVRNPDCGSTGPKSFMLERVPNERISLFGSKVLNFVVYSSKEGLSNGELSLDVLLAFADLVSSILGPCSDLLHRASDGTKPSQLNTLTILKRLCFFLVLVVVGLFRKLVIIQKTKTLVLGPLERLVTKHCLIFKGDGQVSEERRERVVEEELVEDSEDQNDNHNDTMGCADRRSEERSDGDNQEHLNEQESKVKNLNKLNSLGTRLGASKASKEIQDNGDKHKQQTEHDCWQDTRNGFSNVVDSVVLTEKRQPIIRPNEVVKLAQRSCPGHRDRPEEDHSDNNGKDDC